MLKIDLGPNGEILLSGRFDASRVDYARGIFNTITSSSVVDFQNLEYISSAGLGVLLATQKRLAETGQSLKLINMNKHIRDVFQYAGFDTVFQID